MESLGVQLKAARVQKHVSVTQAAHDTRISANHLESFETGRYQSLPGGVYNRAFLRMYSEYLGLDPQAMLDWSDDGGHTWSNEHWASMGKIGEYNRRAVWRRLGQSRERVYRVTITDPVKVAIISAQLETSASAT